MISISNLKSSPKAFIGIILLLIILITLPLFIIVSKKRTSGPAKASIKKDSSKTGETVVPNELIVKFRPMVRLQTNSGKVGLKQTFSTEEVMKESLPKALEVSLSQFGKVMLSPVFPAYTKTYEADSFDSNGLLRPDQVKINSQNKSDSLGLVYKLTLSKGTDLEIAKETLAKNVLVEYVEPNYLFKASDLSNPSDPLFSNQWNLKRIQFPQAWVFSSGGDQQVKVAVIDTGVYKNHPDFEGVTFLDGYDFVNNDTDPTDDQGHGTFIAGIIAAKADNNIGIAGIAWGTSIIPVKGLDNRGFGTMANLATATVYAADQGAFVINMSWGNPYPQAPNRTLAEALEYAKNKGAILVAAAGNSGDDIANGYYPANDPNVIAVSAINNEDKRPDFSNYGAKIALAAPGVDITSLAISSDPVNGYQTASGTSASAPHITALSALIKSRFPGYTGDQIIAVLENAAFDIESSEINEFSGYGLANALDSLQNPDILSPPFAMITTPTYFPFKNKVTISGVASAGDFDHYSLEYAPWTKDSPAWQRANLQQTQEQFGFLQSSNLGEIDLTQSADGLYLIRLSVFSKNGKVRSVISQVQKDETLRNGWPKIIPRSGVTWASGLTNIADVNGDLKKEIISVSDEMIDIYDDSGNPLPGWPINVIGYEWGVIVGYPVVADIEYKSFNESKVQGVQEDQTSDRNLLPLKKPAIIFGKLVPLEGDLNRWGFAIDALRADGTRLDGFPRFLPWFIKESNMSLLTVDVNGDGRLEIVFPNIEYTDFKSRFFVYALDGQGQNLPGWPKDIKPSNISEKTLCIEPTLAGANLDNNGFNTEIVADFGYPSCASRIIAFGDKGILPGWPITVSSSIHTKRSLLLTDLNNDGIYEVLIVKFVPSGQDLMIIKGDGTTLATVNLRDSYFSYLLPADFNKDGYKDIFVEGGLSLKYWLVSGKTRTIFPGFPVTLVPSLPYGGTETYSVAGDIDLDGKIDVIRLTKDEFDRFAYVGNTFDGRTFIDLAGFSPKYVKHPGDPTNLVILNPDQNTTSLLVEDDYSTFTIVSAYDIANKKASIDWGQLLGNQWHTRSSLNISRLKY